MVFWPRVSTKLAAMVISYPICAIGLSRTSGVIVFIKNVHKISANIDGYSIRDVTRGDLKKAFNTQSFFSLNSDEVRGNCVCLPDWGADY